MDKIFHKGKLIGIKITKMDRLTNPLTDPKEPMQFLTLKHPKGAYLKAHYHSSVKLIASHVQECLFLKKGRVRLDIYGPRPVRKNKYIKYVYLSPGDAFIILNGGYGITMLKDSELYEVKNGPFYDDTIRL